MKELRMIKKYPLATAGCCTAFFALLCGCGSGGNVERMSCVHDTDVRSSSYGVSGQMLLEASRKAAQDALNDTEFRTFLDCYEKKTNGKIPVLKIGRIRNNSDDPDIQPAMLLTPIADALFKEGKVRIFEDSAMREIRTRRNANGNGRENSVNAPNDELLECPALMLTGDITTQTEKRKDVNMKITMPSVQITDLQTGMNLWRFSTSFGTKQTKPLIGQ